MENNSQPNHLIHESSPYLLQHAYNPVNWHPWNEDSLNKSKELDKPIILSIGYSACHWCHVMERESFESTSIASIMNEGFICIKVDREERPDIDQVYMDAVQAMGVGGGWPLNVFLTPEQKPFYGGTYFPPEQWESILIQIREAYNNRREELNLSAEKLTNHLSISEVKKYSLSQREDIFNITDLSHPLDTLKYKFDTKWGGINKSPKFPMPSLWNFLLIYGLMANDEEISNHVLFTLKKISYGGINDHLGGGFARYSVDEEWFVPHFEKMLYDNGQLISLFSMASAIAGSHIFGEVVQKSIEFVIRELYSPSGGFYSALDADSEGIEGKFYTWTYDEFVDLIGQDQKLWLEYFGITETGNWEKNRNIPYLSEDDNSFIEKYQLTTENFRDKKEKVISSLLTARSQRIRPSLDNKILASWNGIMLQGLIDAYNVFGDEAYLVHAINNAGYLDKNHINENKILRTKTQESKSINGFLEDYAFIIQSFISLYQATFEEKWLEKAHSLLHYCLDNFYDTEEEVFYFTDKNGPQLIAAKKEIFDNVIPASNSVMAMNLWKLSVLFDKHDFLLKASAMVSRISQTLFSDPEYLSNWGTVFLMLSKPVTEIVITGPNALELRKELASKYIPNSIILGSVGKSNLPLLVGRTQNSMGTIYVCQNKSCRLPVHTVKEAMDQINAI